MGLFRRTPKTPRRRGLIEHALVHRKSTEWTAQYDVEEMERVGDRSRVRIVRLSGVPWPYESDARSLLPDWVLSSSVSWFGEGSA